MVSREQSSSPTTDYRPPTTLWGLTESATGGMRNQVEGVLQALGLPYELKTARRKRPFAYLPIWLHRFALKQLEEGSDSLAPPWPNALITSGRRSAALALEIRRLSGKRTKLIHLTDPRACRWKFSLIAAMAHDPAEGKNVIKTRFALHNVTPEKLAAAADGWAARFAHLPRPYVAVLIGGSTNKYTLKPERMRQVIAALQELRAKEAGSLLITPSRRTGEGNVALLLSSCGPQSGSTGSRPLGDPAQSLRDSQDDADPSTFVYDLTGENPYLGLLALADHIIVTDDSVNMMSEACATGKPVHILKLPEHENTKPARFAEGLVKDGFARWLALPLQSFAYSAPAETSRVREAILGVL
jgi:mitochondrial fission protein ELM1